MNRKFLLLFLLIFTVKLSFAQIGWQQYFDGADTSSIALTIQIDTTDTNNVWQVGPPQKTIFDSAFTKPNALVTDTINTYPANDTSIFTFGRSIQGVNWSVLAIRWAQKLDMDSSLDGGIVEVSLDSGNTWTNIFLDQNVYNLYGYDTSNVKPLSDSTVAFTGTDSTWRDVWLCYRFATIQYTDSITVRFTFRSDSVDNNKEGWMIDNMFMRQTFAHTVSEVDENHTFLVYPTISNGIVKVDTDNNTSVIDNVVVTDIQGKALKRFTVGDARKEIDISDLQSGNYYISIHTKDKIEVHKIVLRQ